MGVTYKRVIYVNDQERIAYEIAFKMGRNALCKLIDYTTYESTPPSLFTRFKKRSWFSWRTISNRYIVLTRKIIEEAVR